jgi:hypothetical protein
MKWTLMLSLAACSSTAITPVDLSPPNHNPYVDMATGQQQGTDIDMATPPQGGPDMAMMGCGGLYPMTTIASMRQGVGHYNCFELDNVITLAVTPVSTNGHSVTIHVQDAAGGDYSAIQLACSSTSTSHPCAAFSSAKNILAGRKVTVQGLYIKAKSGFETFEIDNITDGGSGTAPSPAPLTEVDLERGATMSAGGKPMPAYFFQIVSANITDKLLMFDWSVPEFMGKSGSCPWYGFGMIPTSAGASAGPACNGTTQPAVSTAVNAKEVLVSTDYYGSFTYTADCTCGPMYSQPVPTAGQGVSGTIKALLQFDTTTAGVGYQYVAPLANADFTVK